jgi:helix-turn-helix protein/integrase-like protein
LRKKPNTQGAQVKYGVIREQKKTYQVTVLCRVMGVSTSSYYAWRQAPEDSVRKQRDEMLADKAEQIFSEHKSIYGSRRLSDELKKQGFTVGRFKTRRLMKERELAVRYPKKFKVTTDSNHDETISPNRLNRQFKVDKPNQVWTTDITYVWTLQGWFYVAVVIDLFSRQVVGWAIDNHIPTGHKWLFGAVSQHLACYCWRRLKTDQLYRSKIDQGKLCFSVHHRIRLVDSTAVVLMPFLIESQF